MKSKGAVKFFAIALILVSIFQLSFTWKTYMIEKDAKEQANGDVQLERNYLDSISRLTVYNFLGLKKFTYLQGIRSLRSIYFFNGLIPKNFSFLFDQKDFFGTVIHKK